MREKSFARRLLRRSVTPYCRTPVSIDRTSDTVLKVDPVTHIRLDTFPYSACALTATLSAFADSVTDGYATEVLLARTKCVGAPLLPEQGADWTSGVVTMDDAVFAP